MTFSLTSIITLTCCDPLFEKVGMVQDLRNPDSKNLAIKVGRIVLKTIAMAILVTACLSPLVFFGTYASLVLLIVPIFLISLASAIRVFELEKNLTRDVQTARYWTLHSLHNQ